MWPTSNMAPVIAAPSFTSEFCSMWKTNLLLSKVYVGFLKPLSFKLNQIMNSGLINWAFWSEVGQSALSKVHEIKPQSMKPHPQPPVADGCCFWAWFCRRFLSCKKWVFLSHCHQVIGGCLIFEFSLCH